MPENIEAQGVQGEMLGPRRPDPVPVRRPSVPIPFLVAARVRGVVRRVVSATDRRRAHCRRNGRPTAETHGPTYASALSLPPAWKPDWVRRGGLQVDDEGS